MTSPRSPSNSVASTHRYATIATADEAGVWHATCDRAYNTSTGRSCRSSAAVCAETVWLTIMPKRLPRNISIIIIIGVIYHPPPPAKDGPTIAHITRSLEFLLQRYPAAGVLLVGDFNKMRTSRVTGNFYLKQIVDKPTRKGAILDKILTNMADLYPTPEICSHLGKSDHNIITTIPCMGTTWKHRPC